MTSPGQGAAPGISREGAVVARSSVVNLAGMVAGAMLGFGLTVLVSRWLQPAGAGGFFELIALFTIMSNTFELGADTGLVRWISRARAIGGIGDVRRIVGIALAPVAVISVMAAVAMWMLAPELARVFLHGLAAGTGTMDIRIIAPLVPLGALSSCITDGARGFGRMWPYLVIEGLGKPAVRVVLVVAVLMLGWGLHGAVLAWGFPVVVGLAAGWVILARIIAKEVPLGARASSRPRRRAGQPAPAAQSSSPQRPAAGDAQDHRKQPRAPGTDRRRLADRDHGLLPGVALPPVPAQARRVGPRPALPPARPDRAARLDSPARLAQPGRPRSSARPSPFIWPDPAGKPAMAARQAARRRDRQAAEGFPVTPELAATLEFPVILADPVPAEGPAGHYLSVRDRGRHRGSLRQAASRRRQLAAEFWGFTALRAFQGTFQVVILWLDILLVGAIVSRYEAGIYGAVSKLAIVGTFALEGNRLAIAPQLSSLLARAETSRAASLYQSATRWLMLASWPFYVLLAIFPAVVLGIFGGKYASGATALAVLSLAMLVNLGTGNVTVVLLMGGKSSWSAINAGAALTVNIVLNLVLLPHIGIAGAAIAWAASIVVDNVAAMIEVRWVLGIAPFGAGYALVAGITLGCFGITGVAARLLLGQTLPSLLAAVGAGLAAYAAALYLARAPLQLTGIPAVLRLRAAPAATSQAKQQAA